MKASERIQAVLDGEALGFPEDGIVKTILRARLAQEKEREAKNAVTPTSGTLSEASSSESQVIETKENA